MFELIVSDENFHESDMLVGALERETKLCGGVFATSESDSRIRIAMAVCEKFKDYFLQRVREEIANYIAVEYKYEFFMNNINFTSLDQIEKVAFCSSLAVFDKSTDKKYVLDHLLFGDEIVVDSAVAFCMPKLFDRWVEIAELIESNKFELANANGLVEMMRFLFKSCPCESEQIHLEEKNNNLMIVNDSGKIQYLYDNSKESDEKLLHRIISLLPRQICVHGDRFGYLCSLFPNARKKEVETFI